MSFIPEISVSEFQLQWNVEGVDQRKQLNSCLNSYFIQRTVVCMSLIFCRVTQRFVSKRQEW